MSDDQTTTQEEDDVLDLTQHARTDGADNPTSNNSNNSNNSNSGASTTRRTTRRRRTASDKTAGDSSAAEVATTKKRSRRKRSAKEAADSDSDGSGEERVEIRELTDLELRSHVLEEYAAQHNGGGMPSEAQIAKRMAELRAQADEAESDASTSQEPPYKRQRTRVSFDVRTRGNKPSVLRNKRQKRAAASDLSESNQLDDQTRREQASSSLLRAMNGTFIPWSN